MNSSNKKRTDNDWVVIILRAVANFTATVLSKTPITPNQVTILNFIIFIPLIVYFFIRGSYFDNLIGLGLIFLTIIFDLSDGMLARKKQIFSPHGAWLDISLDKIFQNILFVAIILGSYRQNHEFALIISGLILLFGQNIANYLGDCFEKDFGFDAYSGSRQFENKFRADQVKLSALDYFFKNIIVPSNMIFIFLFTARYQLILAILSGRLDLFLLIFAMAINIRWLSMWYLYFRYLSGVKTNLRTVKILREIKNSSLTG